MYITYLMGVFSFYVLFIGAVYHVFPFLLILWDGFLL